MEQVQFWAVLRIQFVYNPAQGTGDFGVQGLADPTSAEEMVTMR